jgi:hypothetical protein
LEHELPIRQAPEAHPVVIYSFLAMAQFLQLQTTCGEPHWNPETNLYTEKVNDSKIHNRSGNPVKRVVPANGNGTGLVSQHRL